MVEYDLTPCPLSEGEGDQGGEVYPWDSEIMPEHANYDDTKIGATSAVGCFPRGKSAFGCEEMAGNVWEWCLDFYIDNYHDAPDDGSMRGNSGDKKAKVLRGGSWFNNPSYCRCAVRLRRYPDGLDSYGGCRVVVGVACTPYRQNRWR